MDEFLACFVLLILGLIPMVTSDNLGDSLTSFVYILFVKSDEPLHVLVLQNVVCGRHVYSTKNVNQNMVYLHFDSEIYSLHWGLHMVARRSAGDFIRVSRKLKAR